MGLIQRTNGVFSEALYMANIHTFLNRHQLQFRPATPLHKAVLAAAIVLSSVTLVSLRLNCWEAEDHLAELRQRAAQLEQRNEELRQDIDALGSPDSIRDIARQELELVDPDTILFEQAD